MKTISIFLGVMFSLSAFGDGHFDTLGRGAQKEIKFIPVPPVVYLPGVVKSPAGSTSGSGESKPAAAASSALVAAMGATPQNPQPAGSITPIAITSPSVPKNDMKSDTPKAADTKAPAAATDPNAAAQQAANQALANENQNLANQNQDLARQNQQLANLLLNRNPNNLNALDFATIVSNLNSKDATVKAQAELLVRDLFNTDPTAKQRLSNLGVAVGSDGIVSVKPPGATPTPAPPPT